MREIKPKYKRVLLKLSGEVLAGPESYGLHPETLTHFAKEVKKITDLGTQVAIVLGGGNIWRGRMAPDMDRSSADSMGMLATVMNGLAFADALEKIGVRAGVRTAMALPQMAELYVRNKALKALKNGEVVILSGGTGNPYFTTDSAAALRGLELKVDVILKGTKVDGVYDCDPKVNPNAQRFTRLSFIEVLKRDLKVMDATATSLCMDNKLPIIVFDIAPTGNLLKVVTGETIGTLVKEDVK